MFGQKTAVVTQSRKPGSAGVRAGHGLLREFKLHKTLFFMLIPTLLYVVIFSYIPMGGIVIAFKSYKFNLGIFGSPWVGLKNFDFFFRGGQAGIVTRNTILYNVAFIATGFVLQLAVALFIAQIGNRFVKKYLQSAMLLPFFLSWVVCGSFAYNLFNYDFGIINKTITSLGGKPIDIYNTPAYWPFILVLFNNWKGLGYGSLLYLAAILGIDSELFDAAEMDGATILQRIRHITMPMILPTVMILLLLGIGNIMRGNFDMFWSLPAGGGGLLNVTDIIDTYVFRALTTSPDFGMTAAAGLYQSAFCFVIIMVSNYAIKKVDPSYSLF
jgi:putative aldouronate transport system permease protein